MKLSRTERWMLANQYHIMAALNPDKAAVYRGYAEALERGYANFIDRLAARIVRDDTNHEESDEVDAVLAMYDALQRAFRTMDDTFGVDQERLRFPGYDRASEGDRLGYAQFVISREVRYPGLATQTSLDTHAPMVRQYRRMLKAWKDRGGADLLDRQDVLAILAAGV
jgi:hypothetical protein